MIKIIGQKLSNIPWEEPGTESQIIWRSKKNPIIPRDIIPSSNSVFNSAVVPFENEFRGVFRCDNKAREMRLHAGKSTDGVNWEIEEKQIIFISENKEINNFVSGYDPRITKIDDKFYVTWCNDYHGPTIGLAYTSDFKQFFQMENCFLPYNRNGVLFPEKINGNYAMLSRPSDTGHTQFGDIFYSQSPDLEFWGKHRHLMGTVKEGSCWQSTKIGAGPVPIKTNKGWIMIYHGVLTSCNGFVYSMGAALLDLEKPWNVIARSTEYLLSPQKFYECVGDVPNVVFPVAALTDPETGKIAIYYGAADTVTALAFTTIEKLFKFINGR